MSPELIETVARESEAISGKHTFGRFADTRRLKWAGGLIGVPMLLAAGMILLYGPTLFKVLLQRQLLASVEDSAVQPARKQHAGPVAGRGRGDGRVRRQRARSARPTSARLRVKPDGLPADEYKLEFAGRLDDDRTVFAARVPHSSVNFTHRAWVGDGRTEARRPRSSSSRGRSSPRPMPGSGCRSSSASKPNGKPYETYQSQGEITGLANSMARVRIARPEADLRGEGHAHRPHQGRDRGVRQVDASRCPPAKETLPTGETEYPAEATFDLTPDLIAYQVIVKDLNGFANVDAAAARHPDRAGRSAGRPAAARSATREPGTQGVRRGHHRGAADPDRRADPDRVHLPVAAGGWRGVSSATG